MPAAPHRCRQVVLAAEAHDRHQIGDTHPAPGDQRLLLGEPVFLARRLVGAALLEAGSGHVSPFVRAKSVSD
jgi:hypothetical protein